MASETDTQEAMPAASFSLPGRSFNTRAVATFCRQLAVLLDAGIPMVRALKILGRRTSGGGLRNMLGSVTNDVEAGGAFSTALATHGAGLPSTVVPLTRAGEKAGELSTNLRYLADSLDHDAHVADKVKSAMLFPLITSSLATALLLFLLMYIAPLFESLMTDGGTKDLPDMPWVSEVVFSMSALLRSGTGLFVVISVIAAIIFVGWRSLTSRNYMIDFMKIRLPLIGSMVATGAMARFAKTLAALLRTGVPVLESLRLSKATVDNVAIEQAITAMEKSVENGGRMSAPLEEHWYIPELARDMLIIGEESGSMGEMLENLSDVFRDEVDRQQDRLVTLIEPIMILCVGFLVLLVVLAMFLPYIQLITNSQF